MDTVGAAFAAQVMRRPDAIAVMDDERKWTYRDLGHDVDRVARWLVSRGVGPESSVGVFSRRSYALIVGMIAALRAGGAFVPLNPELPTDRLRTLVDSVEATVVLAELASASPARDLGVAVQEITSEIDGAPVDLDARHFPAALAYVIQTSGSTGEPKNVQVEMRAMVNLLLWYREVCAIGPGTRVGQIVASSFDASLKNYLAPLVSGGTVVLLADGPYEPRTMLDFIERNRISVLNPGVPAAFYPLVDLAAPQDYLPLSSLRHVALGGEPPIVERLRPWLGSPLCGARVLNIYGPTECADITTFAELTQHSG